MMRRIPIVSTFALVALAAGSGIGHAQTQFGASDDPSYCEVWGALSTEANARCQETAPSKGLSRGLTIGGTTQGLSIGSAPETNAAATPAAATTAPTAAPPASGTSAATTASTAPTPEAPRSASFGSIQFELDSARLTPRAIATLDTVGEVLSDPGMAGSNFVIEGHTDASGSAGYNQSLSERRARAVADYLVSHHGVQPGQIRSVGRGETDLLPGLAPTSAENRRVVIMNTGT